MVHAAARATGYPVPVPVNPATFLQSGSDPVTAVNWPHWAGVTK